MTACLAVSRGTIDDISALEQSNVLIAKNRTIVRVLKIFHVKVFIGWYLFIFSKTYKTKTLHG